MNAAVLAYCHTLPEPLNLFAYMTWRRWIQPQHIHSCEWWCNNLEDDAKPDWLVTLGQRSGAYPPAPLEVIVDEARERLIQLLRGEP